MKDNDPYLQDYGPGYSGFESWYSEHHTPVLHVMTVVSGNVHAAAEATDEAFARALARWPRVRAMSSPAGWTYRVALNELRRRHRRQQRERQLLAAAGIATSADHDPSLWVQVLEAVRPLTVRQRTVLALIYVADLPQEEVAKLLHVSRSTVASTLSDAKSSVLARDCQKVTAGGVEVMP